MPYLENTRLKEKYITHKMYISCTTVTFDQYICHARKYLKNYTWYV